LTLSDVRELLVGIEHEFLVVRDSARLGFDDLIHSLTLDGRRLDPTDPNAYRCSWGGVITADGREAEIATPPVSVEPGFVAEARAWTEVGRRSLVSALPTDVDLEGYSTHVSVSVPEHRVERIADLYVKHFSLPMMLLFDRVESPGLLVRPRSGRLELCGEFSSGAHLDAAVAFAVGSTLACTDADARGRADRLPRRVRVKVRPSVHRYGTFVHRRAFGPDLYTAGRSAMVRSRLRRTNADALLRDATASALGALADVAGTADVTELERVAAGDVRLPCESDHLELTPTVNAPATTPGPFGRVLSRRQRLNFTIDAIIATWDLTAFEVTGSRLAYIGVRRAHLAAFLDDLDAGRLDGTITGYLRQPAAGRVLASADQVTDVAYFDQLGNPAGLGPPERDLTGARHSAGGGARGNRPGKRRSDERPPGRPARVWSRPLVVGAILAVMITAGIAAVALGGGGSSKPPSTTAPSLTASNVAGRYAVTRTVTNGNSSLATGTVDQYTLTITCRGGSCQSAEWPNLSLAGDELRSSQTAVQPCPEGGSGTYTEHSAITAHAAAFAERNGRRVPSRLEGTQVLTADNQQGGCNAANQPVTESLVAERQT